MLAYDWWLHHVLASDWLRLGHVLVTVWVASQACRKIPDGANCLASARVEMTFSHLRKWQK